MSWFLFSLFCLGGTDQPMAEMSDFEIGIIVEDAPERLQAAHWRTLSELEATAEILLIPGPGNGDEQSRFAKFDAALEDYSERGIPVAVTLTPHLPDIPWRSELDEDGEAWDLRQNIFDPEFRAAWRRYHEEFVARYGQDTRIRRVYVAPPSYFGEVEYFMGTDWSDLKVVAYGPLGETAFRAWLQERYRSLEALSNAWEVDYKKWRNVTAPRPIRERLKRNQQPIGHLELAWIDFMQWRRDYLVEAVAEALEVLGKDTVWELSFKYSHGDTAMTQGTDSAALISKTRHIPNLTLHMTNPHSLPDLRYAANHARLYGVDRFMGENDGNRYNRSELEKIALTGLMTGIDGFNFSSYRHLLNTGGQPTEVVGALRNLDDMLSSYHRPLINAPCEKKHPIAFYHSHSSAWARAPHYTNHDVSRVYDVPLSNGPGPEVRAYDWSRYLYHPDVLGEQHILDGDLDGRELLIVPNSGLTLWPKAVFDLVLDWVRDGGALVGFGEACFTWQYGEAGGANSISRIESIPALPDLNPHYPIEEGDELPGKWMSLHDTTGRRPALLSHWLGEGTVYLYSEPIPGPGIKNKDAFFRYFVPQQLCRLADSLGYPFPYVWMHEKPRRRKLPPLNVAFLGEDPERSEALYVAGGYTGEPGDFTIGLSASPGIQRVVLLLINTPGVHFHADDGSLEVAHNVLPPYKRYQDPTNLEGNENSQIPLTRVSLDRDTPLHLSINP